MSSQPGDFIIEGVTSSGQKFRPSDWAERLCGMLSVFGEDQRLVYSEYVRPFAAGDTKCVAVDARLRDMEPLAYLYLESFAKDNDLRIKPGRPA